MQNDPNHLPSNMQLNVFGNTVTLYIKSLRSENIGDYECFVHNSLGMVQKTIHLLHPHWTSIALNKKNHKFSFQLFYFTYLNKLNPFKLRKTKQIFIQHSWLSLFILYKRECIIFQTFLQIFLRKLRWLQKSKMFCLFRYC